MAAARREYGRVNTGAACGARASVVRAFTIVEFLVVIALLVVLAAISYPAVTATLDRQRFDAALQAARHAALEARTEAMDRGRTMLAVAAPIDAGPGQRAGLGEPAPLAVVARGPGAGDGLGADEVEPMRGVRFELRPFDQDNQSAARRTGPGGPQRPGAPPGAVEATRVLGSIDDTVSVWFGASGPERALAAMSGGDTRLTRVPMGMLGGLATGGAGDDEAPLPAWFSDDESGARPIAVAAPSGDVVWRETVTLRLDRRGASVQYHPLSGEPIVEILQPVGLDDISGSSTPDRSGETVTSPDMPSSPGGAR